MHDSNHRHRTFTRVVVVIIVIDVVVIDAQVIVVVEMNPLALNVARRCVITGASASPASGAVPTGALSTTVRIVSLSQ